VFIMANDEQSGAPAAESPPAEVMPAAAPVSGTAIVGTTTLAAIFPLIWTATPGPNAGALAYRWSDDYGGVRTIQAYYADGTLMTLVSEARPAGGTTIVRT
jgi:hypothetical protein